MTITMEQTLDYRGVRYVIGSEKRARRTWTIYPEDVAPGEVAESGIAPAQGTRGSFKQAVMDARAAIDLWFARRVDHDPDREVAGP